MLYLDIRIRWTKKPFPMIYSQVIFIHLTLSFIAASS